jgi:hypothetical protein
MKAIRWREGVWVFLPAAAVTSLLLYDFCALVYQCGCGSLWAGGSAHCNIHVPGVRHCPWCTSGNVGGSLVLLGILGPQAAASFWPGGWRRLPRLLLALAVFPACAAVLAVVYGVIAGYWG